MRRILLFLTFSIIYSSSVLFAQESFKRGSEYCSHSKSHKHNILPETRGPNSYGHTYDVLNYELDLDIYHCFTTPFPKDFGASNIIQLRVDTALNILKLNAVETSLLIDSVSKAGTGFTHEDDTLYVTLDRTYEPDEELFVKVYYHHKDVSDNAFYVSGGFVFTDCEPQGARKWFPCWDQPSDKATVDITAKVPNNVLLGSNGRLADSVQVADTIWYNWISRDPVPTYITVITARANYNLDIVYWPRPSTPEEPMPVRFYYNPGENPDYIKSIINPMISVFSDYYGEHPFEKDGFATLNSAFQWGGMENQTLTSLCGNCWGEVLVSHELAHQWFGDMITCGTWSDLWLNEGFATYLETIWIESQYGYAAYKEEIDYNASYYLNQNPGFPIYNPEWALDPPPNNVLFNYAITYLKSSCIHHLFRYVVGDEIYFQCMNEYALDTVNFKYKSVVTEDFVAKMNDVTGEDYQWFFDQWVYEPNHPNYQNSYHIDELGADSWTFSTKSNCFKKSLSEASKSTSRNPATIIKVMNDQNYQAWDFYFNKQPDGLEFDPNNNIILKTGNTVVGVEDDIVEENIVLLQNVPNPFADITKLRFELYSDTKIRIDILDMKGQLVETIANEIMPAGLREVDFEASDIAPGIYYYRLNADGVIHTKKMIKM